jgi:excisionase family DNA binding protein
VTIKSVALPAAESPNSELFTVKETASVLKVSTWFVRQRIWRGQLRACLVGTRVRIRRTDLDAFLAENTWTRELSRERTARPRTIRTQARSNRKA